MIQLLNYEDECNVRPKMHDELVQSYLAWQFDLLSEAIPCGNENGIDEKLDSLCI